jgi:hypothetical protein
VVIGYNLPTIIKAKTMSLDVEKQEDWQDISNRGEE